MILTAKFFIFDMDGLMFDTERLFFECVREAASLYGYDYTEEKYIKTIGTAGETLKKVVIETMGKDYPLVEASNKAKELMDIRIEKDGLPLKSGLLNLLGLLKELNIKCCVASSTNSDKVIEYLNKAGINNYFCNVIGGEMVNRSKPAPDIFLKACDECGFSPSEAVVLEDSMNGVRAGIAAGIKVICIPDIVMPDDFTKGNAYRVYNTLNDVIPLLID
ncbi:MAG: HAD family phosphatase [Lachnospiraceae bacterium]|nr:HAD family phosphatase [Lachnospiraceae bacterium]